MSLIVDYMENNKIIVTGKCHPMEPDSLESKWDELEILLNNVPNGAIKDKKQWKCFLSEWKSKTRKKARLAIENPRKTGGGSYDTDQLTELEIRLMKICGWVSVLGCDELPEEIDPDLQENNNVEFSNNNDEEMKISECEVAENGDLTIAQDEDIPITETRTGKNSFKKTKKKVNSTMPQLERTAEIFSGAQLQMAEAIKVMAESITSLATAITQVALAITNKLENNE
ncbi:hypothetical protein NQ314_012384 [Rhamnusium bicolor]|uniref:Regulatory protein zeste n=1 Tax=Rhamnusium bicolor TaxID=1586634 RepID=A0AAV8XD24_9CUCU|nr:hypothetical protein NQ314_012384 [Rhamnusium bicolor]